MFQIFGTITTDSDSIRFSTIAARGQPECRGVLNSKMALSARRIDRQGQRSPRDPQENKGQFRGPFVHNSQDKKSCNADVVRRARARRVTLYHSNCLLRHLFAPPHCFCSSQHVATFCKPMHVESVYFLVGVWRPELHRSFIVFKMYWCFSNCYMRIFLWPPSAWCNADYYFPRLVSCVRKQYMGIPIYQNCYNYFTLVRHAERVVEYTFTNVVSNIWSYVLNTIPRKK